MTGPQVPTAKVAVGGREFELRMTIGALRRLREAFGGNLSNLADEVSGEETLYRMPAMVYALMSLDDRKSISLEEFEEMIGVQDVVVMGQAIAELQTASLPDAPEGVEADHPLTKKPRAKA